MRAVACSLTLLTLLAAPALAKLPPIDDAAKAKAAEATARAAWTDKVGQYKLCQAMDRVVQVYRAGPAAASAAAATVAASAAAPVALPPCADPGTFAYTPITPESKKPLEAAGAHSPPGTAISPPSNKATSAEMTGTRT